MGQGSYGIVKLAYNQEDDTHYVGRNLYFLSQIRDLLSKFINHPKRLNVEISINVILLVS